MAHVKIEGKHDTTVYRESLYGALYIAIEELEKVEKEWGYTSDSCRLATFRIMKDAIESGGRIILRD